MPKIVLTDALIDIEGVDYSSSCRGVTIEYSAEIRETTGFSDTTRTYLASYKNWTVRFDFYTDFADNAIDETLFGLVGTTAAVKIRPTSAAISATNPEYQGNVIVTGWNPLQGSVGEVSTNSVTWQGTATLTRAVA